MKKQTWKQSILRFFTAQTISLFGSALVQYGIIWHITLSTLSGKLLTIATLCGFLPQLAVSLIAGTWIDRCNRKAVIMLSDTLIALATLVLALSLWMGAENYTLLFLVLIVRSAGTGVQTPTVNAIIPQITPKESLMRVNGIQSTLNSVMMFVSPAAGGIILSFAPLESLLLIDVFTAIIGVGLTATIPIRRVIPEKSADFSAPPRMKAGLRYLGENPFVRNLLFYQFMILFLISPSAFLTPLMVTRTFGAEVWRLTASEMTYSLGMVLGGVLIAAWGGFSKRIYTTLLAGALYGSIMIAFGFAPVFFAYLVLNTLIGMTSPCYQTPITVTIQERVPSEMQGRVFSLMQGATSCALPLGMLVFGSLADKIRVQFLFIFAGVLVLLASLAAAGLRLLKPRT